MANKDEILAQLRANNESTKQQLGWTPEGFKNLNSGLQEKAFGAAADVLGTQRGQDANETAGNIVSHVTEPLGHSVAADVLRTGLQTGATALLNPANIVAPQTGIRGTVNNVAKSATQQLAENVAQRALQTGRMNEVNQILRASADDLGRMASRADAGIVRQEGLSQRLPSVTAASRAPLNQMPSGSTVVLKDTKLPQVVTAGPTIAPRIPTNVPGTKILRDKPAIDTALGKVSTADAFGQKLSTAPGVSLKDTQAVRRAIEILKSRGKL